MRIYIGHDAREVRAYEVAARTARRYGCEVLPLYEDRLRSSGMLTRPLDRRGGMWDLVSDAAQSTEFAVARFFVPLLAHDGWCLAVDCDVVFLQDPHELLDLVDESKAVMVVKHEYLAARGTKMDGQPQVPYARKNWSSVVLWNVGHPANRRLNLTTLNQWPGRDLHAFGWLSDNEIGELPPAANWLVGIQDKPLRPVIAHFTEGGPWLPAWEQHQHDEIWLTVASEK